MKIRVGNGYDVHRLVAGESLVLGGVTIPHEKGLLGHSDADVLTHAIIDAILGASGSGDIGSNFPDTDGKYKGIASIKLLAATKDIITQKNWQIENIDATIVAQQPKLAPHIPQMIQNIAAALCIPPADVSIKATTTEGLGFAGKQEGMAAYAVCLIKMENKPDENI